jgi:hypothetical protein
MRVTLISALLLSSLTGACEQASAASACIQACLKHDDLCQLARSETFCTREFYSCKNKCAHTEPDPPRSHPPGASAPSG